MGFNPVFNQTKADFALLRVKNHFLPEKLQELRSTAEGVYRQAIAPLASEIDRDSPWPRHSFRALAEAGLMGLHVPRRLGGQGQGLLALSLITEAVGKFCPSSAMCYGMHYVGTAVVAAKPTRRQEEQYLRPIAAGDHVTTISLSEPETASTLPPDDPAAPRGRGVRHRGRQAVRHERRPRRVLRHHNAGEHGRCRRRGV